jgi:hypothetical protein
LADWTEAGTLWISAGYGGQRSVGADSRHKAVRIHLPAALRWFVSLQVAILKVLASYPGGRATVSAMKADLAVLAGAGFDWNARLKRLAARLPDLDIFSQGFVLRTAAGWQITAAGLDALRIMELPASSDSAEVPAPIIIAQAPAKLQLVAREPGSKTLPLAATERRRRRHLLLADRRRRSAS